MEDKVVKLPLIVRAPAQFITNNDFPPIEASVTTVQLDAESGQIFQVPLTQAAVDSLLIQLASLPEVRQSLQGDVDEDGSTRH